MARSSGDFGRKDAGFTPLSYTHTGTCTYPLKERRVGVGVSPPKPALISCHSGQRHPGLVPFLEPSLSSFVPAPTVESSDNGGKSCRAMRSNRKTPFRKTDMFLLSVTGLGGSKMLATRGKSARNFAHVFPAEHRGNRSPGPGEAAAGCFRLLLRRGLGCTNPARKPRGLLPSESESPCCPQRRNRQAGTNAC